MTETTMAANTMAIQSSGRSAGPRLTLLACILASSLVGMDGLMTTVALPSIADGLGVGLSTQQWMVAAFLLAVGSLLLVGGALGDIYGRWKVFGGGTAGFGLAALVCAAAPSGLVLIVGRLVMGAAAALVLPNVLAVITATFRDEARSKAIASWSAWSGLSVIAGPVVGGLLIDTLSWRAIYWVQVPSSLLVYLLIRRAARTAAGSAVAGGAEQRTAARSVDVVGALLAALAVAGPAFFLIQGPQLGWLHPLTAGALVLGAIMAVTFVWWERRATNPLLPLGLFRFRRFRMINLVTLVLYGALISSGTYTVLFLQSSLDYAPGLAGVIGAVPVGVLFVLSGRFGRLADRFGAPIFIAGGAAVAAIGMLWLTRVDGDNDLASVVLPSVFVHGLGLAMVVAPLTASAMSSVDEERAGVASGINNAVARIGSMVAIAVVGVVISLQFAGGVESGVPSTVRPSVVDAVKENPLSTTPPPGLSANDRDALAPVLGSASVDAFRAGVMVSGSLALVAAVLAVVGLRDRTSQRFDAVGTLGCPITGARTHRDAFIELEFEALARRNR